MGVIIRCSLRKRRSKRGVVLRSRGNRGRVKKIELMRFMTQ